MAGMAGILRAGVAPERAKAVCVFVHGRNQSPEEMEATVIRRLPDAGIAYVLPRAEGGSWYAARAVDPLTPATRADLGRSVGDLEALVAAERRSVPLVLAGFSQGACLSLEMAFAGRVAPDALVALTGCRVGAAGDDRARALPPGLPVYLSAGDADPWIPLAAWAEAMAQLGGAGARLRGDVFPGRPHEVSEAEIAMLASVLDDLAAGRPAAMGAGR